MSSFINEVENFLEKSFNLSKKELYFTLNIVIIFGFAYIFIMNLKKRYRSNVNDINSVDWDKYVVVESDNRSKFKKLDYKDKPKTRTKELNKGTGFIKEENRFPILQNESKNSYLSMEESNNFQDLINYAANSKKELNDQYPIESLYNSTGESYKNEMNFKTNDNLDYKIQTILNE